MKEKPKKRSGKVSPNRIADEANQRFVGLAEQLMRVINWERPLRRTNKTVPDKTGTPWRALAMDPQILKHLSAKMDLILKRNSQAQDQDSSENGEESCFSDSNIGNKLKELFHEDAWHRLAAVRWLRQHGCSEAISSLEGALSIEESEEVKGEIERTLHVLKVRQESNKGELKCSKSSEVSL